MKKIVALLIAFAMVFSLTGCGKGESRDKNVIYLDFELTDSGYGTDWLKAACAEFEELVKDIDYDGDGPMKPGVKCVVKPVAALTGLDAMKNSGTEVFFGGGAAVNNVRTGNLLDITDVVNEKNYRNGQTSIVDLMYEDSRTYNSVETDSGEIRYFGIPTYETYSGMSYDKDAFDKEGFYFAYDTSSSVSVKFNSKVVKKDVYFVKPTALDNKSCGPDGVFDTYDDGMPSSLIELIALYEYMYNAGYSPLQVPGQYLYEADFLSEGLAVALLGVDKARGFFEFTGEYDIVTKLANTGSAYQNNDGTSFLTEYLQPVTETVEVTEESGYYTTWAIERYYALTFLNICKDQGWLAQGYNPNDNPFSHKAAQRQFIFSGYNRGDGTNGLRVATMSTGAYWYNESINFSNFASFFRINKNVKYRNLLWMPCPVNIFASVIGEQDGWEAEDYLETTTLTSLEGYETEITESVYGDVQAISNSNASSVYFNDNVRKNKAQHDALKDWIRFFFSDQQLEKATIRRGLRAPLDYKVRELSEITNPVEKAELKQLMIDEQWADFDANDNVIWEGFYKQLSDYIDKDTAEVVRYGSTKKTFLGNISTYHHIFRRGEYSRFTFDGSGNYLQKLITQKGYTAMTAFENGMLQFTTWQQAYKGEKTATQLQNSGGQNITWGGETRPV